MRWWMIMGLTLGLAATAPADVAAIHAGALPSAAAVTAALRDITQLEPFTASFSAAWSYPLAKADAARRLQTDLAALTAAVAAHPDNVELRLLTGLAAWYGYNVDVDGTYARAVTALQAAAKLAPADPRAEWFLSALRCQIPEQTVAGATQLLALASAHTAKDLPAGFWNDYLQCALMTNMPAHALQAAQRLHQLGAESASTRNLAAIARSRLTPFNPGKSYAPEEIWWANPGSDGATLTATACGMSMWASKDWEIKGLDLQNQTCLAELATGPYAATHSAMRPNLLVVAHRAQPGESLHQFVAGMTQQHRWTPAAVPFCPATNCEALSVSTPGMYGGNGAGEGEVVAWERPAPAYPGLLLERPASLPASAAPAGADAGPTYLHPKNVVSRMPGTIYYVVMLDTASSIHTQAQADLKALLTGLKVE